MVVRRRHQIMVEVIGRPGKFFFVHRYFRAQFNCRVCRKFRFLDFFKITYVLTIYLTHISLASFLWDMGKQNIPRCEAAKRGVPSGAILFAYMNFIEK